MKPVLYTLPTRTVRVRGRRYAIWYEGRLPIVEGSVLLTRAPFDDAVSFHGSQRKAAAALGMNLSTFQRRLAKERATA